jgi:hypothetical protein
MRCFLARLVGVCHRWRSDELRNHSHMCCPSIGENALCTRAPWDAGAWLGATVHRPDALTSALLDIQGILRLGWADT